MEEGKKSHSMELVVAIIGAVGVLGGALVSNWDKIFPNVPAHQVQPVADRQPIPSSPQPQRSIATSDSFPTDRIIHRPVDLPRYRADWAYRFFRPCKAETYNIIIRSLTGDQYDGISALRELGASFPNVAFRLVNTVAADGVSNGRFAIFAGCGLSRADAGKLVALVREAGIAKDAYMVKQGWDADGPCPQDWEIMR